jgi:hypothetical protein
VAAGATAVLGMVSMAPAAAAPGNSLTMHFSSITDSWGTPTQPPPITNSTNCPSYIVNDYTLLNATGNGVTHQNFNNNGFWFTQTFTGTGTVVFYPASSLDVVTDSMGNITSVTITGPSDGTVSGRLTNWDGFEGNKQNQTFAGTINFQGTDASGNPISFHNNFQAVWTPGTNPSGFPSSYHNNANC